MTENTADSPRPVIELVDAVLHLARRLGTYQFHNPDIEPLSQMERLVLRHVHRYPGVCPSDLAHELALRPSNASTALHGLIKKGQLRRESDPADKRGVQLYVTDTAEHGIDLVHQEWERLFSQARVTESDLLTAVAVTRTFEATFDD